ncbi:MAG: primosomal protein N' [Bacillota bacterium]|nr:primosomal protein N' [Bacillota bacterium]
MYSFAGIIINNESVQIDRLFTYRIPKELSTKLEVGYRVKVPFGKGNRATDGFVIELYESCDGINHIKDIQSICDDFPLLRDVDIRLMEIMRKKYFCTYIQCIKTLIPTGITRGVKSKILSKIYLGNELSGKYDKEPYKSIIDIVKNNDGSFTKSELSNSFKISISSINTLIKHEFLYSGQVAVNRFDTRDFQSYEKKTLNVHQKLAVDTILKSMKRKFLIHGVTGSGKTEIYMHLVSEMLNQGKQSIILVPEIALTPQMVERFKGRFGKDIAVFHSKLSDGERYDEWVRVKKGEVNVAVGARSAIFLPFKNLGLIVIDEEHEGSYKSDSDPKYNSREIADIRSELEGCKVLLGSATPSIETFFMCKQKEIELLTITDRADGAMMPKVELVDMREELLQNNKSIFSKKLYNAINQCLENKEQAILFLNRRGYSTFVSCRKCGYVFKCPNCDISLTYHNHGNNLTCHYCGVNQRVSSVCPSCGSKYVKYFGIGTEKIEEEVKKYFPSARVIRMDHDTTRGKNSYEKIYSTFKEREADILIGTQMVAKGLDFKDVTVVGVIAADLSLNLPDYRSAERTFQLITQVSGRAGRGQKNGKVIVQTYNPDNYAIRYSISNDYYKFYDEEISIRQGMNYPPFSKILCINMSSKNEKLLINSIQMASNYLKNYLKENSNIEMLGPCSCTIGKIKEQYRWQIIFKGNIDSEFCRNIKSSIYEILKEVYNDIRVSMDLNPSSLL